MTLGGKGLKVSLFLCGINSLSASVNVCQLLIIFAVWSLVIPYKT